MTRSSNRLTRGAAVLAAHQKYVSGSAANFLPVQGAAHKEVPNLLECQCLYRIVAVNDDRDSVQPNWYADKAFRYFERPDRPRCWRRYRPARTPASALQFGCHRRTG